MIHFPNMRKGIFFLAVFFIFHATLAGQIPLARQKVVVTNERRINSDALEFSPTFYKDGVAFISTRFESVNYNVKDARAGYHNIMSIYKAQRDAEGFLNLAEPFALELIFRMHEGPVAFDRTAENIYFTRNDNEYIAPDGKRKLQIYSAKKEGPQWGKIEKPSFNLRDYNFCHPSVSVDGDVLFIASDMPGGFGGMDIYAIYFVDGNWVEIKNLGPEVNSPSNEVFLYSAADGTLYFSSDRDGGLGKMDLYYTKEWGEKWRLPVNLGVPFSSEADDFGFIVDSENKNGYFSSDRKGGFGYDDIYSFYIDGTGTSIAGMGMKLDGLIVKDKDGNPLEAATVSAIHLNEITLAAGSDRGVRLLPGEDGMFILNSGYDSTIFSVLTRTDGSVEAELNPASYIVKIAKDGYIPAYMIIDPETDLYEQDVRLRKAIDCVQLKGRVLLKTGGRPVAGAALEIVDVNTREKWVIYTDDNGYYDYCLKCNSTYAIFTHKSGMASSIAIVNTREKNCDPSAVFDLPMFIAGDNIFAGMTIKLPNIYFNFDDASLRPDAYPDLDEVVGMLNSYPGMILELASHTDSRGSQAYNLDLSTRRTESVFRYLISKGIKDSRLTKRGYGESQIRNRCKDGVPCTEDEHRFNRRTEVKIIFLGEEHQNELIGERTTDEVRKELYPAKSNESTSAPFVSEKGGQEIENIGSVETENLQQPMEVSKNQFTVIAGTFASQGNAFQRANKLIALGYSRTEIIVREDSGWFAVAVSTYSKEEEAKALTRTLAKANIESYVLRQ